MVSMRSRFPRALADKAYNARNCPDAPRGCRSAREASDDGPSATVPPLRNRRDDIPALTTHFARDSGLRPARFYSDVHQLLLRCAWPGSCRELRGVVVDADTAAAKAGATAVRLEHIPVEVRRRALRRPLSPLEQAEADAILAAPRCAPGRRLATDFQAPSLSKDAGVWTGRSRAGLMGTCNGYGVSESNFL
jgi:hypothetical protein